MASPTAVSAIVRSCRPTFRSKADKVAFAVHAFFMAAGFKLVAVGDAAELPAASQDASEISIDGWNASSEPYSFAYTPEQPGQPGLLVRALPAGELLLVSVLSTAPGAEPGSVELPLERFAGEDACGYGYMDLQALVDVLAGVLPQEGQKTGADSRGAGTSAARAQSQQQQQQQGQGQQGPQRGDEDYEPLRIGPARGLRQPGLDVGEGDLEPPGLRPPPGGPFGPGLGGGGMHMGPQHPFFAGGVRHPEIRPGLGGAPPGLPPGARWDPVRPQGLEGWQPEDFQRGRGRGGTHPDIMPPGPGRGTDWDTMFG